MRKVFISSHIDSAKLVKVTCFISISKKNRGYLLLMHVSERENILVSDSVLSPGSLHLSQQCSPWML